CARWMPSAPRARSRCSPKRSASCGGCALPRSRNPDRTAMTTFPTSMHSVSTLRAAFACLLKAGLLAEALTAIEAWRWRKADRDFITLAHLHQEPPAAGNNGAPWTIWLALGGRGAGKTRLGAEFVRALALGIPPYADAPH